MLGGGKGKYFGEVYFDQFLQQPAHLKYRNSTVIDISSDRLYLFHLKKQTKTVKPQHIQKKGFLTPAMLTNQKCKSTFGVIDGWVVDY